MYRLDTMYRAIQGEGWNTGLPCTVVRFQGYNIRCPFCDTPQAQDIIGGKEYTLKALVANIKWQTLKDQIVLFTGGEPLLQPVGSLLAYLKNVHLETNGTLPVPPGFAWVTVSPKDAPIHPCAIERADEIKWLIGEEMDVTKLLDFLDEWKYTGHVSVQPLSLGRGATSVAYQAAQRYGWRLSLQTHKFIGMA